MLKSIGRGSERAPSLATVLVAWGCALLVCAASASAAPGDDATIVASPFDALTSGALTVTSKQVSCPAGQRIVGGGSGTGGAVDPSYLSLRESSPFDESGTAGGTNDGEVATIWSASVGNISPTPGDSYPERVFANCSANSDAVIEATTGTLAGSGTVGTVTTMCPTGSRAVGGGFSGFGGDADLLLRASNPVDETGLTDQTFSNEVARGWSVVATNSVGGSRSFDVFALCSKNSDATLVVDSFLATGTGEATSVKNCPAGKRVLGGGTGTPEAAGLSTYLTGSAPVAASGTAAGTSTGDVARGWFASVFNSGSGSARYLNFVLCASDPGTGPPPDTTPPNTKITNHPKKRTKKRRATFSFSSTESGGSFECKLDKGAFAPCTSPFKKKVKAGRKHHFTVIAIDAAGNRDLTPATYAWKVRK